MNKDLLNKPLCMDGLQLMREHVGMESVSCCFFDPQYRSIMEKMDYGNEGARQKKRAILPQMSEDLIREFVKEIENCLIPSGYLFLWVDKFILCEGRHLSFLSEKMNIVDMITWDKESFGMGYRTRRTSEHLLIIQKSPKTTKTWKNKSIRDVWSEKIPRPRMGHPHKKPNVLLYTLICSVTKDGDIVLDPCAGSFATLGVCKSSNRNFIGCDISLDFSEEK